MWATLLKSSLTTSYFPYILTNNQKTNSIRPPSRFHCSQSWSPCNIINQSLNWAASLILVLIIQAVKPHRLADNSCVCCHSWHRKTDMVVDFKDFLLVVSKFLWSFSDGHQNLCEWVRWLKLGYSCGVWTEAQAGTALFYCFHGVFDLEELTLRGPGNAITVVKCFYHCEESFFKIKYETSRL